MIFYFQTIISIRNKCHFILCAVFYYTKISQGISDTHFSDYQHISSKMIPVQIGLGARISWNYTFKPVTDYCMLKKGIV